MDDYLAVKFDDEEIPMFGVFDTISLRQLGLMTPLEHMKYAPKHMRLCQ